MTIATEDTEIEDEEEEEGEIIPYKYSISSYGVDYPVDSLVKRIGDGSIYVPSFQRGYVWKITRASRFIESLLLGLPVPGIFLSKEQDSKKLIVIDGQQRLRTLQYFYKGIFEPDKKEFALQGVPSSQFEGVTYDSLKEEDRRQLDDSILHATIVKQDVPSDDDSSIYHIFERLNTGGTLLHPQEIRAAIYHGEFNDLLGKLNKNKSWRSVYGRIDKRMRDQELILRFLALYFDFGKYKKPMKEFLNIYMGKNRHLKSQSAEELTEVFTDTIELAVRSLGRRAFKPKKGLNSAVFDAVMVGIARRLERGRATDLKGLKERYQSLLENEDFASTAFKGGTTSEEIVKRRIKLATEAFSDLE
jgi:uncharacterized protein with ParB-like and HNH nuclease domain